MLIQLTVVITDASLRRVLGAFPCWQVQEIPLAIKATFLFPYISQDVISAVLEKNVD